MINQEALIRQGSGERSDETLSGPYTPAKVGGDLVVITTVNLLSCAITNSVEAEKNASL